MINEVVFVLSLLIVIEIGYRIVDRLLYKLNNIPGEMEEE
jgi:hypothetical protein|tara:strand:- start:2035 stop:2154 length:120 start_codon:yes stop_codon:yes gene_type:complete